MSSYRSIERVSPLSLSLSSSGQATSLCTADLLTAAAKRQGAQANRARLARRRPHFNVAATRNQGRRQKPTRTSVLPARVPGKWLCATLHGQVSNRAAAARRDSRDNYSGRIGPALSSSSPSPCKSTSSRTSCSTGSHALDVAADVPPCCTSGHFTSVTSC